MCRSLKTQINQISKVFKTGKSVRDELSENNLLCSIQNWGNTKEVKKGESGCFNLLCNGRAAAAILKVTYGGRVHEPPDCFGVNSTNYQCCALQCVLS